MMPHGLIMFDADLRVVLCNRQLRALFRFDPDIVRPGATLAQVLAHSIDVGNHPGATFADVSAEMAALAASGTGRSFQQSLPDCRLVSVDWKPMQGGGWVCTYEDITAREAATARAAHLVRHDAVTDLPNRKALLEAIAAAWPQRRAAGFSLLTLEIDRFRGICDICGHANGDAVLQQVATRIMGCMRQSDTLAHTGGAGFAVLLHAPASWDVALRMRSRLVEALLEPVLIDGHVLTVSASMGIAVPASARAGASPLAGAEEVLRNATLAMHRASAGGYGRAQVYGPIMDQNAKARHALEVDLRGALAANQFEVHYQPLVSVLSQVVTGFEALLRWRHPTRGLVSPGEFIPLAEELGLIANIGAWVLRTACAEAATWPSPVRVAVNLSPHQFTDVTCGSLPAIVASVLADTGLPGFRLELEITESVRLQDDTATLDILHALRELGARISLDDFGTGYSSLSYLRCFPFDKIKIDQSFVRSLPSAEATAIVRAVASLGASLGIATVAEGVETQAQLAALVAESCDEMQGYLFSRPRPAADVPELLTQALAELRPLPV